MLERSLFLGQIEALLKSTVSFHIITPEYVYLNYQIVGINHARSAQDGATMITVNIDLEEVLEAGILRSELTKIKGKIITFTQSDKQSLIKSGYNDVNTVHEIQGETFEETAVVRATPTPIGLIARDSTHVLVALTRHTKAMVYYTVVFDAVTSIIADVEKVDQSILTMFATTVHQIAINAELTVCPP